MIMNMKTKIGKTHPEFLYNAEIIVRLNVYVLLDFLCVKFTLPKKNWLEALHLEQEAG